MLSASAIVCAEDDRDGVRAADAPAAPRRWRSSRRSRAGRRASRSFADQAAPRLLQANRARRSPPPHAARSSTARSEDGDQLHGASVYGGPGAVTLDWLSCAAVPTADSRLENYARLAVQVGLNLQPGQTLGINALIEHAPLVRAIAREAYAAGARYVDVLYSDQHVRRAHIEPARRRPARLLAALARPAADASSASTAARSARSPATPSPSSSPTSTASASARRACARSPRRRSS